MLLQTVHNEMGFLIKLRLLRVMIQTWFLGLLLFSYPKGSDCGDGSFSFSLEQCYKSGRLPWLSPYPSWIWYLALRLPSARPYLTLRDGALKSAFSSSPLPLAAVSPASLGAAVCCVVFRALQ